MFIKLCIIIDVIEISNMVNSCLNDEVEEAMMSRCWLNEKFKKFDSAS